MASEMTAALAAQLRQPFADNEVGKLPKVTCAVCRDKAKMCPDHKKGRCQVCRNWISEAHIHVDYVGHAETTDRFLQADVEWNWEPVARDGNGAPFIDSYGGMWIKLTIAGVTRLGYGHADGKKGGDAVKETIGDALRNAGMRFGVGLDLWGAKFEAAAAAEMSEATAEPQRDDERQRPLTTAEPDVASTMVNQGQHKHMHALWRQLGYIGDENRAVRLEVIAKILRLDKPLESSSELTKADADQVIAALKAKLHQLPAGEPK